MIEAQIETVLYEQKENGVAFITINNEKKLNAISHATVKEITRLVRECDGDASVRAIILRAAGTRAFSSGGDLNTTQGTPDPNVDRRDKFKCYPTCCKAIQQCDKPVIAVVKGYAMGAGMSLALSCDLVYAADNATFSSNFNHLGVPPEMGALAFIPQTVGVYKAKEIWWSAKRMSADEVDKLGLVSRVIPLDEIDAEAEKMADLIASLPGAGVRITKRMTNDYTFPMLDAILDSEMQNTPFCSSTPESKKLFDSFFDKKKK